jgi:hypothetical protein
MEMTWTTVHQFPDAALEKRWRELLTNADYAAHYVSPEYFNDPFLRNKNPFAIIALDGDRPVGVLTGIREGHELICGLMSRPQICFAEDVDVDLAAKSLAQGLVEEAKDASLLTLFTWSRVDAFQQTGYKLKDEEGVVMLDLTLGADTLFKGFAPTRRTDIRNAIKRGVEVVIANTREEFKDYYDIYLGWSERKNVETSSFEVMEEALEARDNRLLFLARFENKTVAGTIIRHYPGAMIEYAANTSLPESLKLRPNDLLQWRVVEWACANNYKRYSLGGAHLFSRRMGGIIAPVFRYRLDRTWLRQHEVKEALKNSGRKVFTALPKGVQRQVKRALKGED